MKYTQIENSRKSQMAPFEYFSRHMKKLQEAQEEKPERIIGNTDLISYLSENGDNFHHSELKPTQFMRHWT